MAANYSRPSTDMSAGRRSPSGFASPPIPYLVESARPRRSSSPEPGRGRTNHRIPTSVGASLWSPDRGLFCQLISPGQQAAGNNLRLDFSGALEDVEDARVAQHPADRIFERVTVAAVDLHGVVGIGPGDARGQELRHPRLD